MKPRSTQVPITLVSGYSGAGKSSLLNHLKKALKDRRPAFLYDDGDRDLFSEIEAATALEGADVILVECAASLEPYYVAEHMVTGDEFAPPPQDSRIDTLVTVVDASRFLTDLCGPAELFESGLAFDAEDDRTVSEVLLEQVEFADVIVINKIDLSTFEQLSVLEAVLARLNPRARLVRAVRGQVDPSVIINTGLFSLEETDDGAGWLAELDGVFENADGGCGVVSFTYFERGPFHPLRFNQMLNDFRIQGLIRGKGSVWVASRHNEIGVWSLAGPSSVLSYGGAWFAATPAREWPPDERDRAEIMRDWVPPFGDRRQEIAFIGIGLNEKEIRQKLDECLLTHKEMRDGPDSWYMIPDPLPDWHLEME